MQQEVIEAQKQSLLELSTPIIPVTERIIVMPLIGSIDSMRAREITGVSIVDSGVANHSARLKGARTIVTGISDAVAETIVDLGIDWEDIDTLNDLQTGLVVALDNLGIKLYIVREFANTRHIFCTCWRRMEG